MSQEHKVGNHSYHTIDLKNSFRERNSSVLKMEYRKVTLNTHFLFLVLLLLPLPLLLPSPTTRFWSPCNYHHYKKDHLHHCLDRTHPSKPCSVWPTELNEDTLRGECFTLIRLDAVCPDKYFAHLSVSLGFSPSPVTLQSLCQRRCWQMR